MQRRSAPICAVVILGARDRPAAKRAANGVEATLPAPIRPSSRRSATSLASFIGQPLSRKLIGDIQLAIARVYRGASRPFVSVIVPPQELTGGVLQVRVFEFHVGGIAVSGAGPDVEKAVRAGVRLKSGDPIDMRVLATDMDWLNRDPLTRVEAIFGPGKELAITDLDTAGDAGPSVPSLRRLRQFRHAAPARPRPLFRWRDG